MKKLIPWVLACSVLIENLDVTILSTAIPSIANEVNQDPLHLQVALSNYFIGLANQLIIHDFIVGT